MQTKFTTILIFIIGSFCQFISQTANAQVAPADMSYTQMADTLLYPLNKSYVTTGILYDRVYPFASLHTFNSINPDTSGYLHFMQSYSELYHAAYNNTGMWREGYLDTLVKAMSYTDNTIPIGVLYYNFNMIDTNAVQNNLLYRGADSMYHDVAGRPYSPYWLQKVTVAAALAPDSLPYGNGNFQFKFYSGLFVTNKGLTISSLQADFGNGYGYQNITSGNIVTVYYATGGQKIIRFSINYSDGTQANTYAQINIQQIGNSGNGAARYGHPIAWDTILPITDTQYGYQGYGETGKKYNTGTWAVYYHRTTPGGTIEKNY